MVKIMSSYTILLVISVVISSAAQILLKASARQPHPTKLSEYLNFDVICGYGMMVIATVTTILAYRGLDYKNGPIIESLGYILVMILSRIFFNEKITRRKVIGNLLILAGIFVFYL